MTRPVTFVIATDNSFAAGRDQQIHIHALPCTVCESRLVSVEGATCNHCLHQQRIAELKMRAVFFTFGVLMAVGFLMSGFAKLGLSPSSAFDASVTLTTVLAVTGACALSYLKYRPPSA